jgi:hypothetical protein
MLQRIGLFAALVFLLAFLLFDASGKAQPVINARPVQPNAATIPGSEAYEIAQLRRDVAALREQIDAIRREFGDSDRRISASLAALNNRVNVAQRPVCAGQSMLRDPASGAMESCAPYICNQVAGTCREICRNSSDCASGFVCNERACVRP